MPAIPVAMYWLGTGIYLAAAGLCLKNELRRGKTIEIELDEAIARLEAAKREHLRSVK